MTLRLVEAGWHREFERGLKSDRTVVRVCSPFIKRRAAERLLAQGRPDKLEVITRFDLGAFAGRVSDTSALRLLLDADARIRGVKRLHAKVYVFGSGRTIVTSANLTESGLLSNHEFGLVVEDPTLVASATRYFERLWHRAGSDLTAERIDRWDEAITTVRLRGAAPSSIDELPDEGAEAGLPDGDAPAKRLSESPLPSVPTSALNAIPAFEDAGQAFVKFFGRGGDRAPQTTPVLEEVRRSECHWACPYPWRPKQVREDALMFMARLVRGPRDVRIFGFGIGHRHLPGRDDATDEDKTRREWKRHWRYYIRVDGTRFVDGTLAAGVSLYELMDDLGPLCFATTKRRVEGGEVDVNPRRAYGRQPGVELSPEGTEWIAERLAAAFERSGDLQRASMEQLYWPVSWDARHQ
jgi:hypothetical protein